MPNEFPIVNIRAKYADQTPEGKNLDTALETLQAAIEGKVGFDGEITVESRYGGASYVIPSADVAKVLNMKLGSYVFKGKGKNSIIWGHVHKLAGVVNVEFICFMADFGIRTYHDYSVTSAVDYSFDQPLVLYTYGMRNNVGAQSQWDTTPTENSTNPVTSGGIFSFVKPIYWHGLTLYKGTTVTAFAHILMNTDTPIDTIAKFIAWANSISEQVIVPIIGNIDISGVFYQAIGIIKRLNTTFDIIYLDTTGRQYITNVTLSDYYSDVSDAVNRIN